MLIIIVWTPKTRFRSFCLVTADLDIIFEAWLLRFRLYKVHLILLCYVANCNSQIGTNFCSIPSPFDLYLYLSKTMYVQILLYAADAMPPRFCSSIAMQSSLP